MTVVAAGVALLCYLGWQGRGRLARNCLVFAAILGILGSSSNVV